MNIKKAFDWVRSRLDDNHILSITIENEVMDITRKNKNILRVSAIDLTYISLSEIKEHLEHTDCDFILHINKNVLIEGTVYSYLEGLNKVIGDFGDLFRVAGNDYNFPYYNPEVFFILRGLKQHDKVLDVKRLDNQRYEIFRKNGKSIVIISLNDYDLGIESVRTAIDKFRAFDIVLSSNPNARVSSAAKSLADSLNFKILRWGELYKEINIR